MNEKARRGAQEARGRRKETATRLCAGADRALDFCAYVCLCCNLREKEIKRPTLVSRGNSDTGIYRAISKNDRWGRPCLFTRMRIDSPRCVLAVLFPVGPAVDVRLNGRNGNARPSEIRLLTCATRKSTRSNRDRRKVELAAPRKKR